MDFRDWELTEIIEVGGSIDLIPVEDVSIKPNSP